MIVPRTPGINIGESYEAANYSLRIAELTNINLLCKK